MFDVLPLTFDRLAGFCLDIGGVTGAPFNVVVLDGFPKLAIFANGSTGLGLEFRTWDAGLERFCEFTPVFIHPLNKSDPLVLGRRGGLGEEDLNGSKLGFLGAEETSGFPLAKGSKESNGENKLVSALAGVDDGGVGFDC